MPPMFTYPRPRWRLSKTPFVHAKIKQLISMRRPNKSCVDVYLSNKGQESHRIIAVLISYHMKIHSSSHYYLSQDFNTFIIKKRKEKKTSQQILKKINTKYKTQKNTKKKFQNTPSYFWVLGWLQYESVHLWLYENVHLDFNSTEISANRTYGYLWKGNIFF